MQVQANTIILQHSQTASLLLMLPISWFIFPSFASNLNRNLSQCSHKPPFEKMNTSVLAHLNHNVRKGGYYRPRNCYSKDKVAIIVPFRNRLEHLFVFLMNIHTFLIRQRLEYQIFIVEQTAEKPFNRGSLLNVGVLEAMNFGHWGCFIFHDVDLIPLKYTNVYSCPDQPRHMSAYIDNYSSKFAHKSFFGGVSAIKTEHLLKMNGYSNSFWGWGGEDDDMSHRIKNATLQMTRNSPKVGRYTMLKHPRSNPNPIRFSLLKIGRRRYAKDGLNSIRYTVLELIKFPFFTWIYVDLKNDVITLNNMGIIPGNSTLQLFEKL